MGRPWKWALEVRQEAYDQTDEAFPVGLDEVSGMMRLPSLSRATQANRAKRSCSSTPLAGIADSAGFDRKPRALPGSAYAMIASPSTP